jgi:hypothetical protein
MGACQKCGLAHRRRGARAHAPLCGTGHNSGADPGAMAQGRPHRRWGGAVAAGASQHKAPQCRHAGAQQTRAPHGRRRVGVLRRSSLLRCARGHGVALMEQWRAAGAHAPAG